MPLIIDKLYAPLLLAGLVLLMKVMPWFYDIALGGTDRIIVRIAAVLFSIVKFVIRMVQSSLKFQWRNHSVRYS